VLLGYLTITTANVFHHHNVDIGKSVSSLSSSEKKQNNHLNLLGSEVLCVVHFAYNSLHNSLVSFDSPTQDYQIKPDIIDLSIVSTKPTKETIFNFCLRAPPFSIS
ncbi:MAG: hypothetical protein Q8M94_01960, partial [Ignavibacteria bacterium]|nr:hypothetical protein [Ignavibacteria bacterium]